MTERITPDDPRRAETFAAYCRAKRIVLTGTDRAARRAAANEHSALIDALFPLTAAEEAERERLGVR